jgi:hypothetical protein
MDERAANLPHVGVIVEPPAFYPYLSGHLLHEVEQVCTKVPIIAYGKLVTQGRVADLLKQDEPCWSSSPSLFHYKCPRSIPDAREG